MLIIRQLTNFLHNNFAVKNQDYIELPRRGRSKDYVGCKEFNALANQELIDYALLQFCKKVERAMLDENEDFTRVQIYETSGQKAYDYTLSELSEKVIEATLILAFKFLKVSR